VTDDHHAIPGNPTIELQADTPSSIAPANREGIFRPQTRAPVPCRSNMAVRRERRSDDKRVGDVIFQIKVALRLARQKLLVKRQQSPGGAPSTYLHTRRMLTVSWHSVLREPGAR